MTGNFKKFQKIPLVISIIFLSFSCSFSFFIYKEIKTNNETSEQVQITWLTEASKRQELKSLNSSLEMTKEERALLENHFIYSSDVVPFLDMIEELAENVGGIAEVVLVDIPKDNSGLMVEMKIVGRFETIYKFLILLENSPYELEFPLIKMEKTIGSSVLDSEKEVMSSWSATFRIKLLNFIQ